MPHRPAWYTYNIALDHLWAGDLAAAQESAESDLRRESEDRSPTRSWQPSTAFQGRADHAARVVSGLREKHPALGFAQFLPSQRYKQRERLERVAGVLKRVGLPD